MGWLRRTTIDPPRLNMRRTNTEERPGIPGGIGCEIAAKPKFCLAIGDHAVLGLRDMSAETDQAPQAVFGGPGPAQAFCKSLYGPWIVL